MLGRYLPTAMLLLLGAGLPGCSQVISSATAELSNNLTTALLEQDDVETVRDGAPAFLLILDGLIEGDPENTDLLLAGAQLYGSYGGSFVDDPERARRLTARSLGYARRALCLDLPELCEAATGPAEPFLEILSETGDDDVPVLYGFGTAWAGWIQARSDDWKAIAELPKIQAVMERVRVLDEGYEDGGAHLYLGVLYTLRPARMGGQPDKARGHFERATELSGGRNLMVPVLYAQSYARLVFDRELHDRLLHQVVEADPEVPRLTLTNVLAQRQARELLDGADEYF